MALNIAAFTGRLAADIELRHTQSGTAVTSFSIAVDRNYCKQGEERQTDWIDCQAWRNTAEFISKYFHKGSMIAVDGSMQTRTYEDKNGNKRKAVELVIANVNFCGSKSDNSNANSNQSQPVTNQAASAVASSAAPAYSTGNTGDFEQIPVDDDLPF